MDKLQVEYVPIDTIKEYKHNAKLHPEEQVKQIANSIEAFGMNDPIAIDEDGTIIEGHGRLLAVKKLAKEGAYTEPTVPVIKLTHLTDQQKKAYILAHNKLTLNSGFDIDILNDELASINALDMSAFGFGDAIEEEETDPEDDNYDAPVPVEPKSKLGEIYQLGAHRLMVGDSTKAEDVAALMDGAKADMLLTDPPYNVALGYNMTEEEAKIRKRRRDGKTINNDEMSDSEFDDFLRAAFANANDSLRPGGAFYIWHASSQAETFERVTRENLGAVRQILIWAKNSLIMGRQDYQWKHEPCLYGWKDGAGHYFTPRRTETTVFEEDPTAIDKLSKDEMRELLHHILNEEETPTTILHENKPAASDLHPTMKPIPLFGRLIKNSTRPGEIVLDLFAGSGTTAIAAEQLGRKSFLMEYDPRYADCIIDRWEKFSGVKAKKL